MSISFKPPVVKDLPNQSKKKKKKEPITRRDTKSVTDVNKNTKEDTGMFNKSCRVMLSVKYHHWVTQSESNGLLNHKRSTKRSRCR